MNLRDLTAPGEVTVITGGGAHGLPLRSWLAAAFATEGLGRVRDWTADTKTSMPHLGNVAFVSAKKFDEVAGRCSSLGANIGNAARDGNLIMPRTGKKFADDGGPGLGTFLADNPPGLGLVVVDEPANITDPGKHWAHPAPKPSGNPNAKRTKSTPAVVVLTDEVEGDPGDAWTLTPFNEWEVSFFSDQEPVGWLERGSDPDEPEAAAEVISLLLQIDGGGNYRMMPYRVTPENWRQRSTIADW